METANQRNTYDKTDGQGPSSAGYLEMDDRSTGVTAEHEKRKTSGESRVILLNHVQPNKYTSNQVSTAKYSWLSFLPKFFFEQFRRYANIFFLIVALLQQIPNVSPTGRYTTAVPLAIILIVSAIKEIIEDYKRHTADDATNNNTVKALRDANFVVTKWKDLQVGDIVKVVNGQAFPADLVILSSSEPYAMCYIETSNLDGETNLKLRQGLPESKDLVTKDQIIDIGGHVECESPNRDLYQFVGNLNLDGSRDYPLGPDQLLPRGASLRNTQWVFGVVVYTGHESKVMLNSTAPPLKRSTVEIMTNHYILILLGVLLFLTLFTSIANIIWTNQNKHGFWYLGFDRRPPNHFGYMLLTAFIMYHTIIPISLQVTLEVVRFLQAFFINWDVDMYHEETDTPAMARTSNLNEELGQVKYIFSDKTGTLTRNIMEFRKCSISGLAYGGDNLTDEDSAINDEHLKRKIRSGDEGVDAFLTIMAVCHTVVPEFDPDDPNEVIYQASSPDENALVKAAKEMGYNFKTRTPEGVTVIVGGKERTYKILNVLEFTSERKRMSVVVRDSNNKIFIMVKGADTVIYERLSPRSNYNDITLEHLEDFARIGLRTLCLAMAEISEEEYAKWMVGYKKASTAIVDRDKKTQEESEKLEQNLMLVGATAIEDKLQEGVPETIANLAKADIKIWVLTGDKQETAINIGYSCRLITQSMALLVIVADNLDSIREQLRSRVMEFGDELRKDNDVALIIDGKTLTYALTCDCRRDFLDIALSCKAVICCRVGPLQKAEVVQLVRSSLKNAVTLAIGDGANDVGMIQASHVGVGISGFEGMQAACASDYTIAQFRFLNKLLLVHGAWNYHRLTKLILYSFYKNVCLYVIQFWFAIVSGFSGQIVFERWTIGLYNVIFTAAPPIALGLFDRSCTSENCLKYPQLYKETQSASSFNFKVFLYWVINSVFHSAVLFWLTVAALSSDVAYSNGRVGSLLFLGNMVYTYVVVTVCLKAGVEHTAWTWLSHLAIWGSIGMWFLFFIVYSHVFPVFPIASEFVGMDSAVFSCSIFWLGLLLIPCTALTRDVAWKAMKRTLFHSVREQVMQMERLHEDPGHVFKDTKKRLTEKARLLKNVFTRSRSRNTLAAANNVDQDRGYAFSQEENGAVSQSKLIRSYNSTHRKPTGV